MRADDSRHNVAAKGRSHLQKVLCFWIDLQGGAVRSQACMQSGGDPGKERSPYRCCARKHYFRLVFGYKPRQQFCIRLVVEAIEQLYTAVVDTVGAPVDEFFRPGVDCPEQYRRQTGPEIIGKPPSRTKQFE